jgi:hypothetical protein
MDFGELCRRQQALPATRCFKLTYRCAGCFLDRLHVGIGTAFPHLAIARRVVRELARPRGQARRGGGESPRSRDRFRSLTESETETILGADLLGAIGGGRPRA